MSNMLPTDYQAFIHTSRYARWVEEENRRESWPETVNRYITNVVKPLSSGSKVTKQLEEAILNLDVMPSMRSLMTAGAAANRDNTCMYNCSYLPVDDVKSFDEAMFILLCGTGVGFSVERQYINKLPEVPELFDSDTTIVVRDSKEGWSKALRQVIALLYAGEIPKWDTSLVRPAGARLKTFGGRASGPAPLIDLFNFTVSIFTNAQRRKLNSIECHDLMCKIGEVVVVGGVEHPGPGHAGADDRGRGGRRHNPRARRARGPRGPHRARPRRRFALVQGDQAPPAHGQQRSWRRSQDQMFGP